MNLQVLSLDAITPYNPRTRKLFWGRNLYNFTQYNEWNGLS